MRKIILTFIIASMLLTSLAACGSGTDTVPAAETAQPTGTETVEEPEKPVIAYKDAPDDFDPSAAIGEPGWYPTSQGLVDYCLYQKDQPHCYSWDANGQYLTSVFLDIYSGCYPDWFGRDNRLELRREIQDQGIRAFDCIGMIKAYVWGDYSDENTSGRNNSTNYYCKNVMKQGTPQGPIEDIPEVPGIVVWKSDHVGVYLGDGKVVECTQSYYPKDGESKVGGIIISDIGERGWTNWLEYPGILYPAEDTK